ncbi:hypothetical protein CLU79DRAFT_725900 [Phycomyces nitens]|nr:hypothetical protein CLU79DRAFT_725900 [Phycomyces nitens]
MSKDLKDVWVGMKHWQDEMSAKDSLLSKRKPVNDQVLPSIRKPATITLDGTNPAGIQSFMTNRKGKQVENKPAAAAAAVPMKKPETLKMTRTEKALAEKEKGNAFFRAGDNKNAVLHYGNAIDLDPTTAVYFVNRAMAYLKLNNYLEAERDCTRGLQLQPRNVKALWRRGTALRELGRLEEARKDLEFALELEPGSKAIIEELAKIPAKKKNVSFTTTKPSTPFVVPAPVPAPTPTPTPVPEAVRQRRLPIKVLDEAYSKTDKIQPLADKPATTETPKVLPTSEKSSDKPRPLANNHLPASNVPAVKTPKVSSNPPPVQSTEKLPSKQSSGISVVESLPNQPSNPQTTPATKPVSNIATSHGFPTNAPPVKLACPRTNFEFERDWKTCKHRGDDMLYNYLQCIPPSLYATLFKSSLESDQFEKMIEILDTHYIPNKTGKEIMDVLENLSKVKRIDMLVMFLDKKHTQALQRLFEKSKGSVDNNILARLAKVYNVKL